jgi:hypothetical protein
VGRTAANVIVFMWPLKIVIVVILGMMLFAQYMQEIDKVQTAERQAFFASGAVEFDKADCEVGKTKIMCKKKE